MCFLYPATQKVAGYYVIPSELWVSVRPSVCLSVRLSVSASFPCSNFSTFWPIFFKLCIYIGIGEEWYGIASGLISFLNNRVMALDLCPKCIFGQYLKNEYTNFNKILHMHCIDIGIGEGWYGIASGIISFRNSIAVCPSALRFRALTLVPFDLFSSNFA